MTMPSALEDLLRETRWHDAILAVARVSSDSLLLRVDQLNCNPGAGLAHVELFGVSSSTGMPANEVLVLSAELEAGEECFRLRVHGHVHGDRTEPAVLFEVTATSVRISIEPIASTVRVTEVVCCPSGCPLAAEQLVLVRLYVSGGADRRPWKGWIEWRRGRGLGEPALGHVAGEVAQNLATYTFESPPIWTVATCQSPHPEQRVGCPLPEVGPPRAGDE
jgi:hypothetical protein